MQADNNLGAPLQGANSMLQDANRFISGFAFEAYDTLLCTEKPSYNHYAERTYGTCKGIMSIINAYEELDLERQKDMNTMKNRVMK